MRFLCIGYFDPAKMDALSPAEVATVMNECPFHMERLRQTGRMQLVAGTDNPVKRLRRVDGHLQVFDGLDAGASSKIGCVFIVEAADIDEAVGLAAMHPTTQIAGGEPLGWWTEVRPIHYFEAQPDELE